MLYPVLTPILVAVRNQGVRARSRVCKTESAPWLPGSGRGGSAGTGHGESKSTEDTKDTMGKRQKGRNFQPPPKGTPHPQPREDPNVLLSVKLPTVRCALKTNPVFIPTLNSAPFSPPALPAFPTCNCQGLACLCVFIAGEGLLFRHWWGKPKENKYFP